MLVLTRKKEQSIVIGEGIVITVLDIRGEQVRLGIVAPKEVTVHRQEIYQQIHTENVSSSEARPEDIPE